MFNKRPPVAFLALGVLSLIWGYNWVVMKEALQFSGPFWFIGLRCELGAVALLPVLLWRRKRLTPRSWRGVLIIGLLQMTGSLGLGVWALSQGNAGRTAVLLYTMPVWMVVFSWLILGERLRGLLILAVTLALGGLVLVIRPWSLPRDFFSIILALVGGLLWAGAGICVKILPGAASSDLFTLNAWQLILGGLPLLAIAAFLGTGWPRWTPVFLGALAYNVVLATALGYILWFYVLKRLTGSIAGISTLVVPVLGVVAAWLQLGEVPGLWEGSGIVLIISGLAILTVIGVQQRGEAPEPPRE
jgi:drug/metabolite transporter (DMT)-like permease